MSSAVDELVDKCNQFSNNIKRKLSANEEKYYKKPKLFDTESEDGSSSDSDNSPVKSSKDKKQERINHNRKGFKGISSHGHGGGDAENRSTVNKLRCNRMDLKNNDILAILNSTDSDVEYNSSDSNESLTANNVIKKTEILDEVGDSNSNSCAINDLSKQKSNSNKKLKEVQKSSPKYGSSCQEISDNECSSDETPLMNFKSKSVASLESNSEDSGSDDDEPLSKVNNSKKPENNAISDDNESSIKLENKQCKPVSSKEGVNGTMNQRNSKYGENLAKKKVADAPDSGDDKLKPIKNEMSSDSSDGYQRGASKVKKEKVTSKKGRVKHEISENNGVFKEISTEQKNKRSANTNIKKVFSDSDSSDKSSDEREMSSKERKQRKKYISSKKSVASSNKNHLKNKYKPKQASSESNNNTEDESCDENDINSSEEIQEKPKELKLKQVKKAADLGEKSRNKKKEKSLKHEFKSLSSDSDTVTSVVSDEDIEESKPKKVTQAYKNSKSKTSSSEEETSDKEENLRSQAVNHEISFSESSSDESGMKRSPNANVGSDSNQKNKNMKSKKTPEDDKRIINLKKYLHIAGIRPKNYAELWQGCHSNKARVAKLLELLEKNGLKGRPSIEKCKKLRIKIETKKEIAELDLGNIMDDGGVGRNRRCTRGVLGNTNSRLSAAAEETAEELKNRFSRIKALNSSGSESD